MGFAAKDSLVFLGNLAGLNVRLIRAAEPKWLRSYGNSNVHPVEVSFPLVGS